MSILKIVLILSLCYVKPARADMFGGDVAVLVQILAKSIDQLIQLRAILNQSRDQLDLLRDINRGINDSLGLISTINPNIDPGLYKDWKKVSDALEKVTTLYGIVGNTEEAKIQSDTDQVVAETVTLNNSIYDYSKKIDEIGELIKNQSHAVSPGGAQKLTAQSIGVLLHVQTEALRANATGLKLQAQALAIQNRKDKEQSKQITATSERLNQALASNKPQFILPKF